jgi:hypothetical protein
MPEIEFNDASLLITELCRDHYIDSILRFFARHPFARFDKLVLLSSLGLGDAKRAEQALKTLRDQKLLETKKGGTCLYWLTSREPAHTALTAQLAPKVSRTPEAVGRLDMMQLIMPLTAAMQVAVPSC